MQAELINEAGVTGWPTFRFTGSPVEMARMLDAYDPDWAEWAFNNHVLTDAPNGELSIELDVYHPPEQDRGDAVAELMRHATKETDT